MEKEEEGGVLYAESGVISQRGDLHALGSGLWLLLKLARRLASFTGGKGGGRRSKQPK